MGESGWSCVGAVSALYCHRRGLKQREGASEEHIMFSVALVCALKK